MEGFEGLVDAEERERAVRDLDTSLCVEAGAGTGKTSLLVGRYLSLLRSGRALCTEVVAITFTEKAAGEMKSRVGAEIRRLLGASGLEPVERGRLERAARELERASISTIHAFAASLLRDHPVDARIDPAFEQLDALEEDLYFDERWGEYIAGIVPPHDFYLRRFLALGGTERKLREAAEAVYRARGLRRPRQGGGMEGGGGGSALLPDIVEIRNAYLDRLERLGELARTGCIDPEDRGRRLIADLRELFSGIADLEGESLEDRLLIPDIPKPKGNKANWSPPEACAGQKELVSELAALQESGRTRAVDALCVWLGEWLDGFLRFVEERKRADSVLDFDDLLINARAMLDDPVVLSSLRGRFRFFLVDEFQDTDALQADLILALAGFARGGEGDGETAGGGRDGGLFVVGDPKQSIYRFRGADVEIFEAVKERLGAAGRVLPVTQNFRSVPGIVEWVNRAFAPMIKKPAHGGFQPDYTPICPTREPGAAAAVTLLDLETPEGANRDEVRRIEGEAIASLVEHLVGGELVIGDPDGGGARRIGYGDIAVLYRGTTGIEHYEDPFREREIPYRVDGGRLFYTREEVRALSAAVWSIEDPWDSLSLVATLRSSLFGFDDEEIFMFVMSGGTIDYLAPGQPPGPADLIDALGLLRDLHKRRDERGMTATIKLLLERTKHRELCLWRPNGEQRVSNIDKVLRDARAFERNGNCFRRFAQWLRAQEASGTAEGESPLVDGTRDAVRLMTIHKAKGLQFPVVILANLVAQRQVGAPGVLALRDGGLALRLGGGWQSGNYAEAIERERVLDEAEAVRLLYVAATRARDMLFVPGNRHGGSYFEIVAGALPSVGGAPADGPGEEIPWTTRLTRSDLPLSKTVTRQVRRVPAAGAAARAAGRKELWEAGRRRLLERGAARARIVTPSGAELFAGKEDGGKPYGDLSRGGAIFGLAFHRLMETIGLDGTGLDPQAAAVAADFGVDEASLAELAARTVANELLRRAAEARRCYREVPFTVPFDGDFIEGRIDLLFEENGLWTVVDYKTDAVDAAGVDARLELYRPQGGMYALALERLGMRPEGGIAFLFVRPAVARILPCTDGLISDALAAATGSRDGPPE